MSIWIGSLTGWPYYIFLYTINITLLIISFPLLGIKFSVKSLYASLIVPTFGTLIELLLNACGVTISTIVLECDAFLVVLFGAVLAGFGSGLTFIVGGSLGGFTILESIFLKYLKIPYSVSLYILSAIMIILGMITFEGNEIYKNWYSEGMGSILNVLIQGVVVDVVTYGSLNKRVFHIKSNEYLKISEEIKKLIPSTITYVEKTSNDDFVLICICYSKNYLVIRQIIKDVDSQAFFYASKVLEVQGMETKK